MRVVIIDDHELFVDGLKLLLSELEAPLTFFSANTLHEAHKLFQDKSDIELILLDYYLPDSTGSKAIKLVKDACPLGRIVIISSEESEQVIRFAISQGAAGFIPKSSSRDTLITALQKVLAGKIYLPAHVLDNMNESLKPSPSESLTDRQRDVLSLAIQGMPNKVIADDLHIAEGTVKAHLFSAYQVLGVHNRTEAVFAAAKLGIIEVNEISNH